LSRIFVKEKNGGVPVQRKKNGQDLERLKFETAQEFGLAHRQQHGQPAGSERRKNKDGKRF